MSKFNDKNKRLMQGTFIYDRETRALVFEFDEASQRYMGERLTWIDVQPYTDGTIPCWMDGENKIPHPNLSAVRLTISREEATKGLVMMANETPGYNPMQEIKSLLSGELPDSKKARYSTIGIAGELNS